MNLLRRTCRLAKTALPKGVTVTVCPLRESCICESLENITEKMIQRGCDELKEWRKGLHVAEFKVGNSMVYGLIRRENAAVVIRHLKNQRNKKTRVAVALAQFSAFFFNGKLSWFYMGETLPYRKAIREGIEPEILELLEQN
jgi:hypothetical protein